MEEITAYKPFCCNKVYIKKSSAKRHETMCPHNPANHACTTCSNRIIESITRYVPPHGDQNYGDADYDEFIWYCEFDGSTLTNGMGYEEGKPLEMHCSNWKLKEETDGDK